MLQRKGAVTALYNRVKGKRVELGLSSFKYTPTPPLREEMLPAVFLSEGTDIPVKPNSRGKLIYPCTRRLEISLEIVDLNRNAVWDLFLNTRKTVFTGEGENVIDPVLFETSFISENRTEGPLGYQLPGAIGMRLVLDLIYTDKGF